MNSIPITCPSNFERLKFTEHQFTIGSNNATIVCTDNTRTPIEQMGGAFLLVTIVLLIFNYIWEVKHREIINYLNWDNSNKVCFVFEAGKCNPCLGCLKMFPPQLLILKQWIFLLFAFAAAQFITTQPDTKHYTNVAGFANSFVAMIGITLGIILNTSLQKHEDAIRLFEMYTGDIIALAMELTAFIENAGEGTKTSKALEWNEEDMSENNSKLAEHRQKLVEQIVAILKKVNSDRFTSWKSMVENENKLKTKYPIFYTESRRFPQVEWETWSTACKQFKNWFPSFDWPGGNPTMQKIQKFLEKQLENTGNFKHIAQTRLIGSRDYFLVSLERIFQTLYVLPQVTKHEFRDSPAPAVRFNVEKLKTLDIDYCKYATGNKQEVNFKRSRLYLPMNKFEEELESTDGLSPTQIFLYALLDYINEFHRSVGMESQTRKTLTSAWRRLYGTYGDMSTVKTYDLPRVITMTMELSLIGSCFMLPLSSLHGFVDTCSENCQIWAETTVPFICVAVQFFLTGLYIAAQQVRNPFVSSQESLGFENVTKTAVSAQIGIYQIWIKRGLVQMIFPDELNFGVCNKPKEEPGGETSVSNGENNEQKVETLSTRRFDNRLYHGIRF